MSKAVVYSLDNGLNQSINDSDYDDDLEYYDFQYGSYLMFTPDTQSRTSNEGDACYSSLIKVSCLNFRENKRKRVSE